MISMAFSQRAREEMQTITIPEFWGQISKVPAAGEGCQSRWVTLERWEGAAFGKTEQALYKLPTAPVSILPPLFTLRSKSWELHSACRMRFSRDITGLLVIYDSDQLFQVHHLMSCKVAGASRVTSERKKNFLVKWVLNKHTWFLLREFKLIIFGGMFKIKKKKKTVCSF